MNDQELIFLLENGDLSEFIDIEIDLNNGKPEIRPTKAKLITNPKVEDTDSRWKTISLRA